MFCRILIKMSEPDMVFLCSREMTNKQFLNLNMTQGLMLKVPGMQHVL